MNSAWRSAISRSSVIRAGCPNRWTGTIPTVRDVTAASTAAGSTRWSAGSTSASTGRAPHHSIASAVAVNVLAAVMTSSPGLTPSALSATKIASVPFAAPMQCCAWQYAASSRSNAATYGPWMKALCRITASTAGTISSRIVAYCAPRSTRGIRAPIASLISSSLPGHRRRGVPNRTTPTV